jgi:hypothetical protein
VSPVRIKRGEWNLEFAEDEIRDYRWVRERFPDAELDSIFYVKRLPYHWYRLGTLAATASSPRGPA